MTEGKALTSGFLASVATGRMTVSYLQRQLADGQALVERVGTENVNHDLLVTLAAMESAITSRARPLRRTIVSNATRRASGTAGAPMTCIEPAACCSPTVRAT